MKTKKQRDHQRERRNRKRAERWEREVATPLFVEVMLLSSADMQVFIKRVYRLNATPSVRYARRERLLRLLHEVRSRAVLTL